MLGVLVVAAPCSSSSPLGDELLFVLSRRVGQEALGSSGSDRNETFEALQASLRSLFKSVFDPERGRLAVYMGTT